MVINNALGQRFKDVRIETLDESQEYFCEKINEYILKKYGKVDFMDLQFTQPLISALEKESRISSKKFTLLLNYLYTKKKINPSWMILENNKNQPKFLKILEIDQTIVDLVENIQGKYDSMQTDLNSIRIVIDNSVFKK